MKKLLLIVALLARTVQAQYYVAGTNGTASDTFDGLSAVWSSGNHGPWRDFQPCNQGGSHQLSTNIPILYVLAGVYVENYATNNTFTSATEAINEVPRLNNIYGSYAVPLIITNYQGGLVIFSNCGPNDGVSFTGCSNFIVTGLNCTNCYRAPTFQFCQSWAYLNCTNGGNGCIGVNGLGTLGLFNAINGCSNFWLYADGFYQSAAYANVSGGKPQDGGTHGATFGNYYAQAATNFPGKIDPTGYGIIENCSAGLGGHDCFAIFGNHIVVTNCYGFCNPWINWMTGFTPFQDSVSSGTFYTPCYASSRIWDFGGITGFSNLIENCVSVGGGAIPDMGGAFTFDNGNGILRNCTFVGAAGNSIQVYGKGGGGPSVAGYCAIYNNSSMYSGFCTYFNTNFQPTNIDYNYWQHTYSFQNTSNNLLINNLDCFSFYDYWRFQDGFSKDVLWMANNSTNQDPQWVNTNNTMDVFNSWPTETPPDFHLRPTSPAIAAGTWPAGCISSAINTNVIQVSNAFAFWPGTSNMFRHIPGDTIQFQGTTNTAQITNIVGSALYLTANVTVTAGQGIALPYYNNAPSQGAFDYNLSTAPTITLQPTNIEVNPGQSATFSVQAIGTPTIQYQWYFDSIIMAGVTASSITLLNVEPYNSGTYKVVVSNLFGSLTSSNAILTVNTNALSPIIIVGQKLGTSHIGTTIRGQSTNAPAQTTIYGQIL